MADKPKALQKLVRGLDGRQKLVYVDLVTGQEVPYKNIADYEVIGDSGKYYNPVAGDVNKPTEEEPEDTKKKSTPEKEGGTGREAKELGEKIGSKYTSSSVNSHGFVEKPGFVKYASALPGTLGLAGKAVNVAWNAKNTEAVNQGRVEAGLDPLSSKDTIKGVVRGQNGDIARVGINGQQYTVGYSPLDAQGRTTLTPGEARVRSLLTGGMTELTEDQKAAKAAADTITGKAKNVVSSITGLEKGWAGKAMSDLVGNIFSGDKPVTRTEAAVKNNIMTSGPAPIQSHAARAEANLSIPGSLPEYGPTPEMRPGRGMAALAPVGFVGNFGPNRPNMPSGPITGQVMDAVQDTRGLGDGYTVVGTSGMENPGGQYGSARHKTGKALDFAVMDPEGNIITDPDIMKDLASQFAYENPSAGIGYGQDYMGPSNLHLDTTGFYGGNQWSEAATDKALRETIAAARQGYAPTPFSNAPTTTAKPSVPAGNPTDNPISSLDPVGKSLSPTARGSIVDQVGSPDDSYGKQVVSQSLNSEPRNYNDIATASPAKLASMGLSAARTPEQIQRISLAIAGELSPETLAGLEAGTPEARAELANVVATIENRAASAKYGTLESALTGSQYNSLMSGAIGTTNANYGIYGDLLSNTISDFYTGGLVPTNYDVTSYYNPDLVSPGWAGAMATPELVGDHMFGALNSRYDYGPSAGFVEERNRLALASTMANNPRSSGLSPTAKESGGGISAAGLASRGVVGAGSLDHVGISSGNNSLGGAKDYTSSSGSGISYGGIAGTGSLDHVGLGGSGREGNNTGASGGIGSGGSVGGGAGKDSHAGRAEPSGSNSPSSSSKTSMGKSYDTSAADQNTNSFGGPR